MFIEHVSLKALIIDWECGWLATCMYVPVTVEHCTCIILCYAHVCFSTLERQNHAREVMRTFDVTSIHGIVISSGDGLLYEVCTLACVCGGEHVYNTCIYM